VAPSAAIAWTLSIVATISIMLLARDPRRRGALGLPPDQAAAEKAARLPHGWRISA
jgi:hypothetical protein